MQQIEINLKPVVKFKMSLQSIVSDLIFLRKVSPVDEVNSKTSKIVLSCCLMVQKFHN